MKWLFAAMAAVCLFACGGAPEEMTKEGERSGEAVCDGTTLKPDGTPTCIKNPIVGTWCRSGWGVQYTITVDSSTATIGRLPRSNDFRDPWNGCFMKGDHFWTDITDTGSGNYSIQHAQGSTVAGCPDPITYVPSTLAFFSASRLHDWYSGDDWYPAGDINCPLF